MRFLSSSNTRSVPFNNKSVWVLRLEITILLKWATVTFCVDKYAHAVASGTSISSERQAA